MGTIAPELNDLVYFVQLARTQSFTQAAQRLGLPKSTVSRAVRRLEQRLGVRLAERTTRRVMLTEVGQVYLSHCERVLEQAEQADLAVGALQAQPHGWLRIGTPIPFARYVLGPILGEFLERYPEMRIDLQLSTGNHPPSSGNVDLVVQTGSPNDSGWMVRWLMRVRLGVYASPSYLERHGMPETPMALRRHESVAVVCDGAGGSEPTGSTTWRLRRAGERAEVKLEARVAVPDPSMILQLALAGVGVAVLSQAMTRDEVQAGRLVRLLPEWEPDPVELHALYPSRLSASPRVRALLEFLKEKGDPSR